MISMEIESRNWNEEQRFCPASLMFLIQIYRWISYRGLIWITPLFCVEKDCDIWTRFNVDLIILILNWALHWALKAPLLNWVLFVAFCCCSAVVPLVIEFSD